MADYGIKIAKSGYDITDTDPDHYHFWSKYPGKSIKYQGTLGVTTNSGTDPAAAYAEYTHSYGYIPQALVFTTAYDGGYIQVPYSSGNTYGKDGELQDEYLRVILTSSVIRIEAELYHFFPMSGTTTGIVRSYTFDIILFMEEIETS